jgi:hypothetical protein
MQIIFKYDSENVGKCMKFIPQGLVCRIAGIGEVLKLLV